MDINSYKELVEKLEREKNELVQMLERDEKEKNELVQKLEREKKALTDSLVVFQREKELNFDARLQCFARNVKGSNSCRSKSNEGSDNNEKQQLKRNLNEAKKNAKNIFTKSGELKLQCVICGKDESSGLTISLALIISSAQ